MICCPFPVQICMERKCKHNSQVRFSYSQLLWLTVTDNEMHHANRKILSDIDLQLGEHDFRKTHMAILIPIVDEAIKAQLAYRSDTSVTVLHPELLCRSCHLRWNTKPCPSGSTKLTRISWAFCFCVS